MKPGMPLMMLCFALGLVPPAMAEIRRAERRSLLDSEPGVVYLDQALKREVQLKVEKEAPVFSDKEGRHRLGVLRAGQTVKLEAMTDRIYRVRGQGLRDGIAGWVAPWAFSSKEPDFVARLKELYQRQIEVDKLIAARQVAVGMTLDEVSKALGKPVKTSVRKTDKGQSGRWDFIDYEEVKHYVTRIDPVSGSAYRQFSHMTQEEKSRTSVEFEDDVVTAVEQSEDRRRGSNVRIIVPPLVFGW